MKRLQSLLPVLSVAWCLCLGEAAAGLIFSLSYGIRELDDVIPGTSIGLLVADTGGDGFMGITDPDGSDTSLLNHPMTVGSLLDDDLVILRMVADTNAGFKGFESPTVDFNTDDAVWGGLLAKDALGNDSSDSLMLLYFQDGTANSGDPFGYYRSDTKTDEALGANQAYFTPFGGDVRILTGTTSASFSDGVSSIPGSVAPSAISVSAIPEASQALTSGLLVFWMMLGATSRTRTRRNRGRRA